MTIPDSKKIYPRIGDTESVYLKNVIDNPYTNYAQSFLTGHFLFDLYSASYLYLRDLYIPGGQVLVLDPVVKRYRGEGFIFIFYGCPGGL